jgi:hypothetical protein
LTSSHIAEKLASPEGLMHNKPTLLFGDDERHSKKMSAKLERNPWRTPPTSCSVRHLNVIRLNVIRE